MRFQKKEKSTRNVAIKVALLAKASRLAHVYKDWLARTVNLSVSRNKYS
jgi:hypothetical protein